MHRSFPIAFLSLALAAGSAFGQGAKPRGFPLPGHGSLELRVPGTWDAHVQQPAGEVPPTITFNPKTEMPFEVSVTPFWQAPSAPPLPQDAMIRTEVAEASKKAAETAVEREIPIRQLKGSGGAGYYFSVTDRAPNPGEFKYLSRGIYRLRDLVIDFTVLTNDGQEAKLKEALDMIRSARHAAAKAK